MSPLARVGSFGISLIILLLTSLSHHSDGQTDRMRQDLLLVQNGSLGLRGGLAFHITRVRPESPAAQAGLRSNDLIFAVNDIPVSSREELDRTLLQPSLNPGTTFVVTFGRFDPATGQLEMMKKQVTAE